jgi:hypothetical protein
MWHACVVELTRGSSGKITIPVVHYAVDCGIAVNTDRCGRTSGTAFGARIGQRLL